MGELDGRSNGRPAIVYFGIPPRTQRRYATTRTLYECKKKSTPLINSTILDALQTYNLRPSKMSRAAPGRNGFLKVLGKNV